MSILFFELLVLFILQILLKIYKFFLTIYLLLYQNFHMKKKKIICFDLDGTLAPSKERLDDEMAELINKLL